MAQHPPVGHGLRITEVSRSQSDTPHSVGLLWASDRPILSLTHSNYFAVLFLH